MAVDSDFAAAYENKYKTQSNLAFAFNGYHFALLVGEILEKENKPLTSKELISKLRNYKAQQASTQRIHFKTTESFGQYFSFPIELKRVDSKLDTKG